MRANHELLEIAESMGFQTIEITSATNGAPSKLGDSGVIGFDTYEDAEHFVKAVGGSIVEFQSKCGWHFWLNKGAVYKPFSIDTLLDKMGDDYNYADTTNEFYREQLVEEAGKFDGDFDSLERNIHYIKDIIESVDDAEDDECVIVHGGRLYGTVKKTMMAYEFDTHKYAIGVLLRK